VLRQENGALTPLVPSPPSTATERIIMLRC